jgi:P-type E1-E2 ATPase
VALGVAAVAWAWSGSSDRFLAVIVIATPCPLLIAIPVAIIGAVSLSARRGIIVKTPAILEQLSICRTLILDKTGTLTFGRPQLTDVICASGFERSRALEFAASAEHYSKHPLAVAIQEAAKREHLPQLTVTRVQEVPGQGMRAEVEGQHLRLVGRSHVEGMALPPVAAGLECILLVNDQFAALFRFRDAPRDESRPFIRHLVPKHHLNKIMLLSGDRESEVRYLADTVGICEIHASQSPEQKVEIVRRETEIAKTIFVGDGINDAPALTAATVGIAFGSGSDITSEAADAVVLEPSLQKIDELFHIGMRMRRIALQSALGGMAISVLGMIAAALGYLPPIAGAVGQEILDLLAVLNAVRVATPPRSLTDFD